jgi:hypothetical protein
MRRMKNDSEWWDVKCINKRPWSALQHWLLNLGLRSQHCPVVSSSALQAGGGGGGIGWGSGNNYAGSRGTILFGAKVFALSRGWINWLVHLFSSVTHIFIISLFLGAVSWEPKCSEASSFSEWIVSPMEGEWLVSQSCRHISWERTHRAVWIGSLLHSRAVVFNLGYAYRRGYAKRS